MFTPSREGFDYQIKLTLHFLKRKEQEYNRIKNEWEQLVVNNSIKKNVE